MGAAREEGELDKELGLKEIAAGLGDELGGGGGGAPGGEEVIDEDDALAGSDGIDVHLDGGLAVLEGVGGILGLKGEFTLFADGDEADAQLVGDGGAEKEAACVDADDFVWAQRFAGPEEEVYGLAEEGAIGEEGGDVFENDAGLGEIGYIADGFCEAFRGDLFHAGW